LIALSDLILGLGIEDEDPEGSEEVEPIGDAPRRLDDRC